MRILQWNAQGGIVNKLTTLTAEPFYCDNLLKDVGIMCFSETLLPDERSVRANCWEWFGRNRRPRDRGIGFLCHDSLDCRERPDLSSDGVEDLWIEVTVPRGQSFLLGTCYVHPGDDSSFDALEGSLQAAAK